METKELSSEALRKDAQVHAEVSPGFKYMGFMKGALKQL